MQRIALMHAQAIAALTAVVLFSTAVAADPAEICGAFTTRILSAARHEAGKRIDRAEIEGSQAISGLDQQGGLLDLLPAAGLPPDPGLVSFGVGDSAALRELDRPFVETRAGVELVPDLDVDLSEHYRRILRAPRRLGLEGPQCHLPELAFRAGDRHRPQLRVLKEYRDIEDPDCRPLQYLRLQDAAVSYDLVETRNEVFVFRDTDAKAGNQSICAFKAYYGPSDVLVGQCKSDFCRHLQQFTNANAAPLFVRESGGGYDSIFRVQLPRALSNQSFSVSFVDPWGARTVQEPLKGILQAAGSHPPMLLFEVKSTTSEPLFMGVYLRPASDQTVEREVRIFRADIRGVEILDELPIASMTVLGALIEVTTLRSAKFP